VAGETLSIAEQFRAAEASLPARRAGCGSSTLIQINKGCRRLPNLFAGGGPDAVKKLRREIEK